jgi:hypothetical protein
VANDDELVRLLSSIDRRLALLTASEERDLRKALTDELLRTPARIAMFQGIDGSRGSNELAKLGGVSERAAQLFVKELLELGLVRPVATAGGGRTVIVERDDAAVTAWYLEKSAGSSSKPG